MGKSVAEIIEESKVPSRATDARSLRALEDDAARAWTKRAHAEAFRVYRILCHRDPDEPRHPHRAAEMCMKLEAQRIAVLYLRRALHGYAKKGLFGCAIAVARLGLRIAPDDLPFNEQLGTLLTIRLNEQWLTPDDASDTLAPSVWMERAAS